MVSRFFQSLGLPALLSLLPAKERSSDHITMQMKTAWTKYNLPTNPKNSREKVGVEFHGKNTRENSDFFNSSCFLGRSSSLFGREKHVLMMAMYGLHIWMSVQIGDQRFAFQQASSGGKLFWGYATLWTTDLYTFKCCGKSSGLFVCT